MTKWGEVTAVFGGRFDPIHNGHLVAIRGLFEEPGIKRALVLPTPASPLKPAVASIEDRLKMVELALADAKLPGPVQLDTREIERHRRNPGAPIYSFDTIQDLKKDVPNLAFVVGNDQWADLPRWHRFQELLGLCHWIVLKRKGEPELAPLAGMDVWGLPKKNTEIRFVSTPAEGWSSTQIRESISRDGSLPEGALPTSVAAHLKRCGLYGISKTR
jgi:nicotinate-nucleotide adenylyltransferase